MRCTVLAAMLAVVLSAPIVAKVYMGSKDVNHSACEKHGFWAKILRFLAFYSYAQENDITIEFVDESFWVHANGECSMKNLSCYFDVKQPNPYAKKNTFLQVAHSLSSSEFPKGGRGPSSTIETKKIQGSSIAAMSGSTLEWSACPYQNQFLYFPAIKKFDRQINNIFFTPSLERNDYASNYQALILSKIFTPKKDIVKKLNAFYEKLWNDGLKDSTLLLSTQIRRGDKYYSTNLEDIRIFNQVYRPSLQKMSVDLISKYISKFDPHTSCVSCLLSSPLHQNLSYMPLFDELFHNNDPPTTCSHRLRSLCLRLSSSSSCSLSPSPLLSSPITPLFSTPLPTPLSPLRITVYIATDSNGIASFLNKEKKARVSLKVLWGENELDLDADIQWVMMPLGNRDLWNKKRPHEEYNTKTAVENLILESLLASRTDGFVGTHSSAVSLGIFLLRSVFLMKSLSRNSSLSVSKSNSEETKDEGRRFFDDGIEEDFDEFSLFYEFHQEKNSKEKDETPHQFLLSSTMWPRWKQENPHRWLTYIYDDPLYKTFSWLPSPSF